MGDGPHWFYRLTPEEQTTMLAIAQTNPKALPAETQRALASLAPQGMEIPLDADVAEMLARRGGRHG